MAGEILVDGQPGRAAGNQVSAEAKIERQAPSGYVSRAAGKLAPVLKKWNINVSGLAALDVGASTGGFTQTLLEAGARKVYAVDVGTGQLAWKLRQDPRVVSLEQTDIRKLASLPEPIDLIVVDVSFTSLRKVLPAAAQLAGPGRAVVALFKPQFEVDKPTADRFRGVITDSTIVTQTLNAFTGWLAQHNWRLHAAAESAVIGSKGNREHLLYLETPAN